MAVKIASHFKNGRFDVIIATDCIDHGLVLIELDGHYAVIAAHLPLKRHAQPGRVPE